MHSSHCGRSQRLLARCDMTGWHTAWWDIRKMDRGSKKWALCLVSKGQE